MRRTLAMAAMAAMVVVVSGMASAALVDVSGTWDLSVNSPNGTGTRVVKLSQAGEKLTGSYESTMSVGKLSGTVKANDIDFVATVSMEAGTFDIRYTGKIADDKMSGDVDFGEYGKGTWSATKRK